MKFLNNVLLKNTIIIIISGFIVKFLGLLNRILITRILGPDGVSLYILSFPTIMLLISISGLSLNVSTTKLVAETLETKKYNIKEILKYSIKISLITSLFVIILFILFLPTLTNVLLKNSALYLPLSTSIILIPLVGISDTLRGYFNGIKKMGVSSMSMLIEQFARIFFSILFIFIFISKGIEIAVSMTLLSLSFGELFSIIFTLIKIKKHKIPYIKSTSCVSKAVLDIAIPTTLSRLIGNFTFFIEPIVYTFVLVKIGLNLDFIHSSYTTINAYVFPLLMTFSFFTFGISSSIIPHVSEAWASNNNKQLIGYTRKAIVYSILPGIFLSCILYFFPSEIMKLMYATTDGSSLIKQSIILFLPYYIIPTMNSVLHSIGCSKLIFINSTIFNIIRILLMVVLCFINSFGYLSLLYSSLFSNLACFIVIYLQLRGKINYKIKLSNVFKIAILTVILITHITIFKSFNFNFVLVTCCSMILYIFASYCIKFSKTN